MHIDPTEEASRSRTSPEGEREAEASVKGATAGSAENGRRCGRGGGAEPVAGRCVQYPAHYAHLPMKIASPSGEYGGVL